MKDLMGVMKQLGEMQFRMQRMQEELAQMEIDGQAGGGLVKVVLGGKGDLKKLTIDPSLMKPGEAEILGIPVDLRRKSTHEENVEILKEYIASAKENKLKVLKPKQTSKGQRGRANRSVTKAGKKSRGLVGAWKKN